MAPLRWGARDHPGVVSGMTGENAGVMRSLDRIVMRILDTEETPGSRLTSTRVNTQDDRNCCVPYYSENGNTILGYLVA